MDPICNENQKKIDAYINGSLGGDELKRFVFHVKNCDECMEELKINYSLLKALDQLEKGDELSENYDAELENGLETYLVKRKRGIILRVAFCITAFLISLAVGIVFSLFYFKNDDLSFLKKGEKENFILEYDGVPDYFNEIKNANNSMNDDIIEYLYSLKLEDEGQSDE